MIYLSIFYFFVSELFFMDYFLHDQLIRLSNPFYDDEEIRDYKILLNMNI